MDARRPRTDPHRTTGSPAHLSWLAWRGFWLAMLAAHGPAAAAAWLRLATAEGAVDPARIAGLSLSVLFFLLKLWDVRWLRFRPGWRTMVALTLVVGVIHLDVLGFRLETDAPRLLAVVSGAFLLDPARRRHDRCPGDRPTNPSRARLSLPLFAAYAAHPVVAILPQQIIPRGVAPPRAPPV